MWTGKWGAGHGDENEDRGGGGRGFGALKPRAGFESRRPNFAFVELLLVRTKRLMLCRTYIVAIALLQLHCCCAVWLGCGLRERGGFRSGEVCLWAIRRSTRWVAFVLKISLKLHAPLLFQVFCSRKRALTTLERGAAQTCCCSHVHERTNVVGNGVKCHAPFPCCVGKDVGQITPSRLGDHQPFCLILFP